MAHPTKPPDVPLPPGAHAHTGWEPGADCIYRCIYGGAHLVDHGTLSVEAGAVQLGDGSMDPHPATVDEGPGIVLVSKVFRGQSTDCLCVGVNGARELAAALTKAADEIDGWANR